MAADSSEGGAPDVHNILSGMTNDSDALRKLAVFHLQSLMLDPTFTDSFVAQDGISILRRMVMEEHGNTLAYAIGSLNRVLDQDMGWDDLGQDVIGKVGRIHVTGLMRSGQISADRISRRQSS